MTPPAIRRWACPMCIDGVRRSRVLGRKIPCPFCGGRGRVGHGTYRRLKARLRERVAREGAA